MYAIRSYYEEEIDAAKEKQDSATSNAEYNSIQKTIDKLEEEAATITGAGSEMEKMQTKLQKLNSEIQEELQKLNSEIQSISEEDRKIIDERIKELEKEKKLIAERIVFFRITSYNVCYTKLLRQLLLNQL